MAQKTRQHHESASDGARQLQTYSPFVMNRSFFSLENAEPLLEFPTISRWLHCFVADSLQTESTRAPLTAHGSSRPSCGRPRPSLTGSWRHTAGWRRPYRWLVGGRSTRTQRGGERRLAGLGHAPEEEAVCGVVGDDVARAVRTNDCRSPVQCLRGDVHMTAQERDERHGR